MTSEEKTIRHVISDTKDGRSPLRYRVQFIDEKMIDEAIDVLKTSYLSQENYSLALDVKSDERAVQDLVKIWKNIISQGASIAAVLEEGDGPCKPGSIIGLNVLKLENKGQDFKLEAESKKGQKYVQAMEDSSPVDIFEYYNCDRYISGAGLVVLKEYQNRGVGYELFKAREQVCKRFGYPAIATIFSGREAQHLAEKCGYKTLFQLDMATYSVDGERVFPTYTNRFSNWMAIRYF